MHFHTIGNRCWCGHLTVPNRFHERDSRGNVIGGKGEGRYLAWLASDEKPDFVNPPVMAEIKRDIVPESPIKRTDVPLNPQEPGRRGRPKKWASEAKRKAAYKEGRK